MSESQQAAVLFLPEFLPYKLNQLSVRISQALSAVYSREFDLSIPEWRIIATLGASSQPLSAKMIGQLTWMDKAKVSRALATLVEKGWIDREREEDDQRQSRIVLSQAGEDLYERLVPKALEWEAQLLEGMSATDYRDLQRLLKTLEQKVQQLEQQYPS
ncbi:MarR family winged helix-turn-helix transcriptional regulator [Balneatrix alpica]|uniref:MarR family winged helix-turn-helix transcriptional regulator n=1 Tax=Balneatrix alpica TaxID=75684 RepID=A0ABV5ZBN8_9GAMM|nr:MarR family transcriptional regulator [Balneatrix alpica]